jgi:hypothetical protein
VGIFIANKACIRRGITATDAVPMDTIKGTLRTNFTEKAKITY